MTNLAYLGTGLIGGALAEASAKRGDRVVAWNRTRAKAEALAPHGVKAAATPAEAIAGADRVHLALPDDAAIDAVLGSCGSGLAGKLVIDHSTAAPAGTAARAARLKAQGVDFLHCPVFMSPEMCRKAAGIMLASGPQAVFDKAAPELRRMTGTVEYQGERPDLSAALKLFGNAMILTVVAGFSDVLAMAKSLGVAPATAHGLFNKLNPAAQLGYRGLAMIKGDYKPAFELTMARKDARLMLEAAGAQATLVLPAIARRMDELIAKGHGQDDLGVLAVDAVPKAG